MSDFEQLKPCPFCGGRAELDTQRGFLAFPNGKLENQVAVYCAGDDPCLADMSICYSDHPDVHPDVVVRWAVDQWNTRSAIASMQGEAVEWFARRKDSVDYPFPPYWVPITKEQFESDDFNIPQIELKAHFAFLPSASAEISRLTKELEVARKDADRLRIVLAGHGAHGFAVSRRVAGNYGIMSGNEAVQAIDAAIRQIGGAE